MTVNPYFFKHLSLKSTHKKNNVHSSNNAVIVCFWSIFNDLKCFIFQYSTVILSDIFTYTCINSRPLFLAIMSELFLKEKKRTLFLLLNILAYEDLGKRSYVHLLYKTTQWIASSKPSKIQTRYETYDIVK